MIEIIYFIVCDSLVKESVEHLKQQKIHKQYDKVIILCLNFIGMNLMIVKL